MAHYVVADIHGEADRFHAMLEKSQFSDEDMLYILGDVIDRGPDGIELLQEIMHTPNMVMLLGNHEHMMLQYLSPGATGVDIRRWNKNGNAPTLAAYLQLSAEAQQEILYFLRTRPTHLEVTVNGQNFYLVHAWPADNVHDEVWFRPEFDAPNPKPGYRVIIGHTKVLSLIQPEEARIAHAIDLEDRGEHLRILHTPGFIDIDCGCGYDMPIKALACMRLEDMYQIYVVESEISCE